MEHMFPFIITRASGLFGLVPLFMLALLTALVAAQLFVYTAAVLLAVRVVLS